jgi:hypothetical protein
MSNLNAFLVLIQRGQFFSPVGVEDLFTVFGDLAFNLGHQYIQLYYRTFAAAAQLTDAQRCCNAAMRLARITIEKNYAMVSNLFHICAEKDGYKIVLDISYICVIRLNCKTEVLKRCARYILSHSFAEKLST